MTHASSAVVLCCVRGGNITRAAQNLLREPILGETHAHTCVLCAMCDDDKNVRYLISTRSAYCEWSAASVVCWMVCKRYTSWYVNNAIYYAALLLMRNAQDANSHGGAGGDGGGAAVATDMLEVPHASVTLGREIGKGAFGRVFIASATNICGRAGTQLVAVKQMKSEYSVVVVGSDIRAATFDVCAYQRIRIVWIM